MKSLPDRQEELEALLREAEAEGQNPPYDERRLLPQRLEMLVLALKRLRKDHSQQNLRRVWQTRPHLKHARVEGRIELAGLALELPVEELDTVHVDRRWFDGPVRE